LTSAKNTYFLHGDDLLAEDRQNCIFMLFFVPWRDYLIMRPDYSHKIFGDKRLLPFLRLENFTRIRH
jgi:hypothetical protein